MGSSFTRLDQGPGVQCLAVRAQGVGWEGGEDWPFNGPEGAGVLLLSQHSHCSSNEWPWTLSLWHVSFLSLSPGPLPASQLTVILLKCWRAHCGLFSGNSLCLLEFLTHYWLLIVAWGQLLDPYRQPCPRPKLQAHMEMRSPEYLPGVRLKQGMSKT